MTKRSNRCNWKRPRRRRQCLEGRSCREEEQQPNHNVACQSPPTAFDDFFRKIPRLASISDKEREGPTVVVSSTDREVWPVLTVVVNDRSFDELSWNVGQQNAGGNKDEKHDGAYVQFRKGHTAIIPLREKLEKTLRDICGGFRYYRHLRRLICFMAAAAGASLGRISLSSSKEMKTFRSRFERRVTLSCSITSRAVRARVEMAKPLTDCPVRTAAFSMVCF